MAKTCMFVNIAVPAEQHETRRASIFEICNIKDVK